MRQQAKVDESAEPKPEPTEGKLKKIEALKSKAKIDPLLESQFQAGRLYASIASRPGQSGRCDGYVLEGKELEFYLRRRAFYIVSTTDSTDMSLGLCTVRAGKSSKHG